MKEKRKRKLKSQSTKSSEMIQTIRFVLTVGILIGLSITFALFYIGETVRKVDFSPHPQETRIHLAPVANPTTEALIRASGTAAIANLTATAEASP